MSQYPYQPPSYPYGYYPPNPLNALLAPARRASIFMFILAGLLIPCGGLIGMSSFADFSGLPGPQQAQLQALEQQLAPMNVTLQRILQFMAAFVLVPGIIFLMLGVVVRRGGLVSVVLSLLTCGGCALFIGFMLVSALVQGGGGEQVILGACVWAIPLALLVASVVFLLQAVPNAGQIKALRLGYGGYSQYGQVYPQPYQQGWQQPWNGTGPNWNQPWPPSGGQPPSPPQNWPPPSNPA